MPGGSLCFAAVRGAAARPQESIKEALDELGFAGRYATIYAPGNPARKTNLGYAFIDFLCLDDLKEFHRRCNNRPFDKAPALPARGGYLHDHPSGDAAAGGTDGPSNSASSRNAVPVVKDLASLFRSVANVIDPLRSAPRATVPIQILSRPLGLNVLPPLRSDPAFDDI